MFKVEELRNALRYYEIDSFVRTRPDAPEDLVSKSWYAYYEYQRALSNRVNCQFSLHDLISNICYCQFVEKEDRLQVLLETLETMNIEIESEKKE